MNLPNFWVSRRWSRKNVPERKKPCVYMAVIQVKFWFTLRYSVWKNEYTFPPFATHTQTNGMNRSPFLTFLTALCSTIPKLCPSPLLLLLLLFLVESNTNISNKKNRESIFLFEFHSIRYLSLWFGNCNSFHFALLLPYIKFE